ncbi:poly(A) binding protein Crp79 [Mucor velutinosus]|uniref:Poly(A) binding protein Crp79 n=1 Tax=Mucor velutinosus TaxID=708070 RepID=A0AAN7HZS1_9FUNG|nr:poly(A) binding protein Crp79 [Mucor velutinosus]
MVSSTQDHDSSATHTRPTEQDSRLRVSPSVFQESMDDPTASISTDSTTLGPIQYRSLRRQDDKVITKLRVVDVGSGSSLHGCSVLPMDPLPESLRKSSLESHLTGFEQDQTGTSSVGDSGGALLAQCSLVP